MYTAVHKRGVILGSKREEPGEHISQHISFISIGNSEPIFHLKG